MKFSEWLQGFKSESVHFSLKFVFLDSNRKSPCHPNTVQPFNPVVSLPAGDPATVPGCDELESNAKRDIRWCLWKWTVKIPSRTLPKLVITQRAFFSFPSPFHCSTWRRVRCGAACIQRSSPVRFDSDLTALSSASRFVFSIHVGFWIWSWFNGFVSALLSKCVFLELSCAIC